MSRAVLSIGSNLGDRLAHLQSVLDACGDAVSAVSPVYATPPWGGVEQGAFLNAVVIVEDPATDARGWLHRGQRCEAAARRVRGRRWGPRTLDVDVIAVTDRDGADEDVRVADSDYTLPHPLAHRRAFVLVPWLAADPDAHLTVEERRWPVSALLARLDPAERAGVTPNGALRHRRRGGAR